MLLFLKTIIMIIIDQQQQQHTFQFGSYRLDSHNWLTNASKKCRLCRRAEPTRIDTLCR